MATGKATKPPLLVRVPSWRKLSWPRRHRLILYRRDGVLGASLWEEIERTMKDLLAYPGTREWWDTRKHWHTDEFARVVDEIIAQGHEPKAYATYNLREISQLFERHRFQP